MCKDNADMSFECDDNYLKIHFYDRRKFEILVLVAPLKFEEAGATELSKGDIEHVEKLLTAVLTNNYLNVQQLWECALASAKPLLTQYFANQQQMIELYDIVIKGSSLMIWGHVCATPLSSEKKSFDI